MNVQEKLVDLVHRDKFEEFVAFTDSHPSLELSADDPVVGFIIDHDRDDFLTALMDRQPKISSSTTAKKQQSLLHLATLQSSRRVLTMLVHTQSEALLNAATAWGETALHLAASSGSKSTLDVLLSCGKIDQSAVDRWGRTAGDVAKQQGHHHQGGLTCFSETTERNQSIQEEKANIEKNRLMSREFMSALTQKVMNPEQRKTTTIKVKTIFGETKDHFSYDTLNKERPQNDTPEGASIIQAPNLPNLVEKKIALSKLLEYPGDPSLFANLDSYDVNGRDVFGLSALHKLSSWDSLELIGMLLSNSDVDVNQTVPSKSAQFGGFTALHFAIDNNSIRAAKRLLQDPRTNCSIKDKLGRNALELARERNFDSDVVELLNLRLLN